MQGTRGEDGIRLLHILASSAASQCEIGSTLALSLDFELGCHAYVLNLDAVFELVNRFSSFQTIRAHAVSEVSVRETSDLEQLDQESVGACSLPRKDCLTVTNFGAVARATDVSAIRDMRYSICASSASETEMLGPYS